MAQEDGCSMKKTFALIASAVMLVSLFTGCHEEDDPIPTVEGCWELASITTKSARLGSETVDVYIQFDATSFILWQKIGDAGRFTQYGGSYTFTEGVLSGTYSTGKAWGPYNVTLTEAKMTLENNSEKDSYNKITALPSDLKFY